MNICMIAYTFYEVDNRVKRYAETLSELGFVVDVVALRSAPDMPSYEVLNKVNVYRIQDRIINENSNLSYLWRVLKFLFKSFWFVTKNNFTKKYKLVHVHSVPDFEVFSALIPKIFGAKVFLDIHDIVPEFYNSKFGTTDKSLVYKALLLLEKVSIGFSDHVIISNHIWEKRIIQRSTQPDKCTTILNYPDENVFQPAEKKKEDKLIMIYPGTLNWHQGVDIAIKAFSYIAQEITDLEFHIYGDGPEKPHLEQLIDKFNLNNRIFLKGFVPTHEMAKYMAQADIGVVPKRNDSFGGEAFSTKTLEFMSLKVPIIVSRTIIDQFYFNSDIVRFFSPNDPKDLSVAICDMVLNKNLREELKSNAYQFVQENKWGVKKEIYLGLIDRYLKTDLVNKNNFKTKSN